MATLYAVYADDSDTPDIHDTEEEARDWAAWLACRAYRNSAVDITVKAIPAALPSETGIRTEFDIRDFDMGGYSTGFYPATIERGRAELVGDGPLCGECARSFLRENAGDETVTLFGGPVYESADGEYCEDCGKSLCEPYCQVCTDVRDEDESREWYQCDNGTRVCPRCMAVGRYNTTYDTDRAIGSGRYAPRVYADRLAPGVYDLRAYEDSTNERQLDARTIAQGTFYAPSCGHNLAKLYESRRADVAR